jgi:hypothetical protein
MMTLVSLLLLLFVSETFASNTRGLIADFSVHIASVSSNSLAFNTGTGGGANPNVKILVYDYCRTESSTRNVVGEMFPGSSVGGIKVDKSGVKASPGVGNVISFSFVEGIAENTDIYTDNGDKTANVEFCVEIGLYDGTTMLNFKEAKLSFAIDLITNVISLAGEE